MTIAHVGGLPLEEVLPAATGGSAALLLARAWLAQYMRRQRKPER